MLSKRMAHVTFWITCGVISAYITVQQFLAYFENADTPKISFRTFNKYPDGDDVYPDITFCFIGLPYEESYLLEHHSFNKLQYKKLLSGDENAWKNIPNSSSVAKVNFDESSIGLERLVLHYWIIRNKDGKFETLVFTAA